MDAAAVLMRERLSAGFSVDELASAAEVSRRTIFNHFASIDEVVIEVFGHELGAVVERLATPPSGATGVGGSMFDELADTFRTTDLISPMVYLTRILGNEDPTLTARQAHLAARAFTAISERLIQEVRLRHPAADPLTVSLLVSSMTHGLMVIYSHWSTACGAVDTIDSRRLWSQFLERLLESFSTGFGTA